MRVGRVIDQKTGSIYFNANDIILYLHYCKRILQENSEVLTGEKSVGVKIAYKTFDAMIDDLSEIMERKV